MSPHNNTSAKPAGKMKAEAKTGRQGKPPKPELLAPDEAASAIVRAVRSGEMIDDTTMARLGTRWKDAAAAAFEGEAGLQGWVRMIQNNPDVDPAERQTISDTVERALAEPPPTIPMHEVKAEPQPPPRRMKLIGAAALAAMDLRVEWLIKGVMVTGEACAVGAPKKTLKTSVMLDMAVSMASATLMLGEFEVSQPRTVLMLSGESGKRAIRNTLERICRERGLKLPDLDGRLYLSFELPRLTEEQDLVELGEMIEETGAEVVIIDPLYLCLLAGRTQVDPSNVMQMGPVLDRVGRVCLDRGATPVVVHHFSKGSTKQGQGDEFPEPELGNLAYSGLAEWARQWVLLSRRSRYVPGSGHHEIWMTVGGSAGHSGEWKVNVEEGVQDENFEGRVWQPQVINPAAAIAEADAKRDDEKRAKEQAKDLDNMATNRRHEEKIMDVLNRYGGPQPKSFLISNTTLSGTNGQRAIERLKAAKRITITPKGNKEIVDFPEVNFDPI